MFAIVDLSRRPSRGQILMIVDDQTAANEIAGELNHGATEVSVHVVTAQQLEQVMAGIHLGRDGARSATLA